MSPDPKDALRRAVASLGLEPRELPSGAGHDAAIFALAGVPSAMLFVRSDAGGVSHAPDFMIEGGTNSLRLSFAPVPAYFTISARGRSVEPPVTSPTSPRSPSRPCRFR
jgi:hypothetical protein